MFEGSTALRSAIVFATCPLVLAFSRLVIFDMTLTFFVGLALAAFWLDESAGFGSLGLNAIMFASMGIATITKGPVGFLLPLLSIFAYKALQRRFGDLKKIRWGVGVLIFLAAVLPWFIAVSLRNPDFPRYALFQESLQRFATGGQVHRQGGFFYYVPVFLAGFFPWSLFLLFVGWNRLRCWKDLRQAANGPILFLLSWAGVVFVFFSVSHSQLPAYFLPAVIPLSMLVGRAWEEVGSNTSHRAPDWLTAGFAVLLGLGLLTAVGSQPWILAGAKARAAKKFSPAAMQLLRPTLLYSGLILGALAIVGRNIASRLRGFKLAALTFGLVAVTVPMLALRWLVPLRLYAESHSSRKLAETILASSQRDWPLYGYYYFRSSLPFYLRRPVRLITFDGSELTSNYVVARYRELQRGNPLQAPGVPMTSAARHPTFVGLDPAPPDRRSLVDILEFIPVCKSSSEPRLILVRNSQVSSLAESVANIEPLWNGWDYSLWEVPPGRNGPGDEKPHRVIGPFTP